MRLADLLWQVITESRVDGKARLLRALGNVTPEERINVYESGIPNSSHDRDAFPKESTRMELPPELPVPEGKEEGRAYDDLDGVWDMARHWQDLDRHERSVFANLISSIQNYEYAIKGQGPR